MLDNPQATQCVERDDTSRFPILRIGEKGWQILRGNEPFRMTQIATTSSRTRRPADDLGECDPALFEELRQWRRAKAAEQDVPPYVVFSDRTLRQISHEKPADEHALASLHGVGDQKLERYGEDILSLVRDFKQRGG